MASALYPPLGLDDFHFDSMDTTEDITYYFPGGYHPIVIGDVLSPSGENSESGSRQYRIMHKLGYGSYSTVWLAQKTDSSETFVAVKVAMAEDDLTREVAMLKAASKFQTNDGRPSHFLNILDYFTLHGPNGSHFVLVTEIVVSLSSLLSLKCPQLWHKTVAHGLAQAVANLHSAGIIHGGMSSVSSLFFVADPPLDLHIGNVGFAIPQIAGQDAHDIMQYLGPYDITIIVPKSAANQTPSLPAYVLAPSNLVRYYNRIAGKDLPQIKIFDFGTGELLFSTQDCILTHLPAHEIGTHPLNFQCAVEACAPELAFAQAVEKIDNPPVEPPADVWALGAAVSRILHPLVPGADL